MNLGDDDNYIKIIYSDKTDVEWTPMLASVTYAYRYDGYGFADCDGTLYESAAAQLCALSFVEGFNKYEFRPYDSLSRAELAQVVARILNVRTGADGERVFTDVAVGHWASGAVGALYYMGIISGDENKRFNPDDTVTYIEAAKILVCALGYTAAAESEGGYPGGYRSAANRLKLFDGLDLSNESTAMNRGDAAVMIQNALAAKAVYNISFGDNAKFKKDGETLLSIYHNIQKTEGAGNPGIHAKMRCTLGCYRIRRDEHHKRECVCRGRSGDRWYKVFVRQYKNRQGRGIRRFARSVCDGVYQR